jgi:hypothetical protein
MDILFPSTPPTGNFEFKIDGKPIIFVIIDGIIHLKDTPSDGEHLFEYTSIPSELKVKRTTVSFIGKISKRTNHVNCHPYPEISNQVQGLPSGGHLGWDTAILRIGMGQLSEGRMAIMDPTKTEV